MGFPCPLGRCCFLKLARQVGGVITIQPMNREQRQRAREGLIEHQRRRCWQRVRHELREPLAVIFGRNANPFLSLLDIRTYRWTIADWFLMTL